MGRAVVILILSAAMLSGCGFRDSRLNPFNWFGGSTSVPAAGQGTAANPLIPRRRASILGRSQEPAYGGQLVGQVTELLVERRPGGAVVRATGVSDYQGPFELRLVPDAAQTGNGVLAYELRAYQIARRVGTPFSRTVTAGLWLPDGDLAGVRQIRVQGARNALVSSR